MTIDPGKKVEFITNNDDIEVIDYDLSPGEGIEDHDAMCVAQASKLLQIGYLEYETAVYGCAYYKDGQRNYYVASKDETMDKFQRACYQKGIYPTPAKYFCKRYDLIHDTEEHIKTIFRLSTARSMQEDYPLILFEAINALTEAECQNAAFPIMQQLTEQLDSCFDLNQLDLFESLMDLMFRGRLITPESYILLQQWLGKEHEKIAVEPIASGDYKRTYAGFAYKRPGSTQIKYFIDAFPYMAKEKQILFMSQGCICTPILNITYYADSFNSLMNVRDTFKAELEKYLGEMYIRLMELLRSLPSSVDHNLYHNYLEQIKATGSKAAIEAFTYYGYLWNVKFE